LATDYEVNYQSMVKNLNVTEAYQLYRDYLDHFRMNRGRN
jgi:adenine-specific DNA-methyltransferase